MNNSEYFDGFAPQLPNVKNILPSYHQLLGTTHGNLYVSKLLRKGNRNILLCVCSCGRQQLFYRWQLKDKLSCTVCGIYTEEYIQKNSQISEEYYNNIKQKYNDKNVPFEVSYEYVKNIFKDQQYKCSLTGRRLIPYLHINDLNGTACLTTIEPSKGFVQNNITFIHKEITKIKNNLNVCQLLDICKEIIQYNDKDKIIEEPNIF